MRQREGGGCAWAYLTRALMHSSGAVTKALSTVCKGTRAGFLTFSKNNCLICHSTHIEKVYRFLMSTDVDWLVSIFFSAKSTWLWNLQVEELLYLPKKCISVQTETIWFLALSLCPSFAVPQKNFFFEVFFFEIKYKPITHTHHTVSLLRQLSRYLSLVIFFSSTAHKRQNR